MTTTINQLVLLGRYQLATLITELKNGEPSRLVIRSDDKLVSWVRLSSAENYKDAVLRLAKKIKRRISYVFIVPVVANDDSPLPITLKRTRLEIS